MPRYAFIAAIFIAAMLTAMLPSSPASAVTPQQKMATCKFGADDQKLQGPARNAFMKKCMANRDDPRGPGVGAKPTAAGAPAKPTPGGVPPPPRQ